MLYNVQESTQTMHEAPEDQDKSNCTETLGTAEVCTQMAGAEVTVEESQP